MLGGWRAKLLLGGVVALVACGVAGYHLWRARPRTIQYDGYEYKFTSAAQEVTAAPDDREWCELVSTEDNERGPAFPGQESREIRARLDDEGTCTVTIVRGKDSSVTTCAIGPDRARELLRKLRETRPDTCRSEYDYEIIDGPSIDSPFFWGMCHRVLHWQLDGERGAITETPEGHGFRPEALTPPPITAAARIFSEIRSGLEQAGTPWPLPGIDHRPQTVSAATGGEWVVCELQGPPPMQARGVRLASDGTVRVASGTVTAASPVSRRLPEEQARRLFDAWRGANLAGCQGAYDYNPTHIVRRSFPDEIWLGIRWQLNGQRGEIRIYRPPYDWTVTDPRFGPIVQTLLLFLAP